MARATPYPSTVVIGGAALGTAGRFDVIDPATGEPFATAPAVSAEQVDQAVRAADAAFATWRRDDGARRAARRCGRRRTRSTPPPGTWPRS